MLQSILALNKLGKVDIAFICICAGIVVAIVAIYFLIPVFRKAQYQQQIDNLRAREAAIKAAREGVNLDENLEEIAVVDDSIQDESLDASSANIDAVENEAEANDGGDIAE
ncbi:MAG: hypothetical protein IKD35_05165 [Clostridia bacterium]|nr:hypothetical protein [Clostridia bacterium]